MVGLSSGFDDDCMKELELVLVHNPQILFVNLGELMLVTMAGWEMAKRMLTSSSNKV